MDYRPISEIIEEIKEIRKDKAKIDWELEDMAADMEVLASSLIVDVKKFIEKGNKSAGKRVRDYTKALESIGLAFRNKSVKEREGEF